jgi:hypothetical protein
LDGYAASHRAVRELRVDGSLPSGTKLRSSKYLNNLIEQNHRQVGGNEGDDGPGNEADRLLNFFPGAQAIGADDIDLRFGFVGLAGIELMHRIRKGQFRLDRDRGVSKVLAAQHHSDPLLHTTDWVRKVELRLQFGTL